jgi:ureidoglycolate lyase
LRVEPLVADRFAPFGDVIEWREATSQRWINAGTALRLDGLCDLRGPDANFAISVVRASARALPFRLECLERHNLASQVFLPWSAGRFLVVVAPGTDAPQIDGVRCFAASGRQGVHYRPGTWHHPLISLDAIDFLVIDQAAPGGIVDCDITGLVGTELWIDLPERSDHL